MSTITTAKTPRVPPLPTMDNTKASLLKELEWLKANGQILSSKRARPKMTYTDEDIAAMKKEEAESEYEDESDKEDESDEDD